MKRDIIEIEKKTISLLYSMRHIGDRKFSREAIRKAIFIIRCEQRNRKEKEIARNTHLAFYGA